VDAQELLSRTKIELGRFRFCERRDSAVVPKIRPNPLRRQLRGRSEEGVQTTMARLVRHREREATALKEGSR
jgi:hypothetical protein